MISPYRAVPTGDATAEYTAEVNAALETIPPDAWRHQSIKRHNGQLFWAFLFAAAMPNARFWIKADNHFRLIPTDHIDGDCSCRWCGDKVTSDKESGWWTYVDCVELVDVLLDARSFYDMESGDPEEPMARITRLLEAIDKGPELYRGEV